MKTFLENITDIIVIVVSVLAVLIAGSFPSLSASINYIVGLFFIVACLPHLYDMKRNRSIYTDYMVLYTFQKLHHKLEFFLRNAIVYSIYLYLYSFNLNPVYLAGVGLLCFFDLIIVYGLLNTSLHPYLAARLIKIEEIKSNKP